MGAIPDKTLFFKETGDYGRYDPEYGEAESYWFCVEDYSISEETKLLEKLGYESVEQLNNDPSFIPVWKTNITELKREFLNSNDEYRSYIEKIEKIRQDYTKFQKHTMPWYECSFSQAFNMFFNDGYPGGPVWDEWERYMAERLRSDFISWCERNHLNYDLDEKYLSCQNIAKASCYDPAVGLFNEYWVCRENYEIYDEAFIMSKFGYKSEAHIENSGKFVHIPRLDISELKREFLERNESYWSYAIEIEELMIDYTKDRQQFVPDYECSYSNAFNMLFSPYHTTEDEKLKVVDEWQKYRSQKLIEVFIPWCEENNIRYKRPQPQDALPFTRYSV